ncbi:peptidase inhibitor family I36 protein [Streptomyces sp. MC1]|uniref:peptidase inhibitor family I36 protein n=1 Tax=Streptomyces sp. MC1 TaxID=295105 RepID=UPI0018CBDDC6|nr:peptidase inhibitor family I36 protein [Streptomyces sp. MC1]MBG7704628.1 peptidase inhibitor family I36 protein [Streptomyces sp. MC1]
MRPLPTPRPCTGRTALLAAAVPAVLAASLTGLVPAHTTTAAGSAAVARDQIACPRGFVCIYPDINFNGQPYVKRAVDGSVRHLPDYIRGKGSSVINNSSRTARVYQKDNYFGRHVCVGREGGTISDLRSYQLNDTTHSLRNNDTPCGAS